MRNLATATSMRHTILAFTAVIVLCAPVWAQRSPIRRVIVTNVKPDRVADFETAVKQYNEAYAKITGGRSRTMFQSLTGPHQYLLVRDYEKWSDLDPSPVSKSVLADAELARINLRIGSCIESSTTMIEELLPDLSTPRPPTPPTYIRLARSRIRPDKVTEFEAIVKNELLPAQIKAGTKAMTVRRVRFGGPTNEYYISTRLENWAEIGSDTLRKSMGDDVYQRMVAKLTQMTLERELNLFRFRADLSYSAKESTTPSATASR